MSYNLKLDSETADGLFRRHAARCHRNDVGDEPERDKKLIAACELLLKNFGKP